MKTLIATALILASSASAFARSLPYKEPAPASAQKISNHEVQTTLFGEGARQLYDILDVEPKFEFGFIQTYTKETQQVSCVKSYLGDVPGTMAGPKYHCKIVTSVR